MKEAKMQSGKENVRDKAEVTPRDDPNPVGQDSAKNEYGAIGEGGLSRWGSEFGSRQSHTEGAGFILQQNEDVSEEEEEEEDIRPS
jgi:hypothetical protein